MKREELIKKLAIGLHDCRTANNVGIQAHFTSAELYDFANTLTHYLPTSLNLQFADVDEDVFQLIQDKEVFLQYMVNRYIREVYVKIVKGRNDLENELTHLIILSLLLLSQNYDREPEEILSNGLNYYRSLLIESDDLAKTVHDVPALGAVALFNNEGQYVRMDYNNLRFVPTLTTKQNFKYLIPKEWNL